MTAYPHLWRGTLAVERVALFWHRRPAMLAALYGLVCLFFVAVWMSGSKDSPLNLATALVYLAIRSFGVAMGVQKLRQAHFRANAPAHWMLLAFCVAFVLDAIGAVIWLTYNLLGVLVPYPSLADIGYGGDTILWAAGLMLLFSVLDTTPQEEVGPFFGFLTAVWSLDIVLIPLILGSSWTSELPKVVLDIFYPFMWALNCALAGSILFGSTHRRLRSEWRWFIALLYAGALVTFLTNVAYTITAACPANSPAAQYLYYNGGPLDFLFATGDFLLVLAIIYLPLDRLPFQGSPERGSRPADAGAGPAAQPRLAEPAETGGIPRVEAYHQLVGALEEELRFLRHELEVQGTELQERDRLIAAFVPRLLNAAPGNEGTGRQEAVQGGMARSADAPCKDLAGASSGHMPRA